MKQIWQRTNRRRIMTLEYLKEQKEKYRQKQEYFKNINFNVLEVDFEGVVHLIGEMENYVKEKEDDQSN
jgi:hypothetical protein